MNDINIQLKKLYENKWNNLLKNSKDINAASPLLVKVSDDYINADIKIMICGQETYGWNGTIGDKNIDFLLNQTKKVHYSQIINELNLQFICCQYYSTMLDELQKADKIEIIKLYKMYTETHPLLI